MFDINTSFVTNEDPKGWAIPSLIKQKKAFLTRIMGLRTIEYVAYNF